MAFVFDGVDKFPWKKEEMMVTFQLGFWKLFFLFFCYDWYSLGLGLQETDDCKFRVSTQTVQYYLGLHQQIFRKFSKCTFSFFFYDFKKSWFPQHAKGFYLENHGEFVLCTGQIHSLLNSLQQLHYHRKTIFHNHLKLFTSPAGTPIQSLSTAKWWPSFLVL